MSRHSRVLLTVSLAALALAGCQRNTTRVTLGSNKAHEDQLRQLLRERQRILEGIADNAKRYVDAGRMTASEYAQARKAALLAGLDLCETQAERVAIRREIVASDEQTEAWLERRAASGRAGEGERNQAKLTRIESEIDLLKERCGSGLGENRQ